MTSGQSMFDGTWRTEVEQAKLSTEPYVFSTQDCIYDCPSYNPKIHVKADGRDQRVSGHPYDTISILEIDARSLELTAKKQGKVVWKQTRTVSEDGERLNVTSTQYPPDSQQTVTLDWTAARIGKGPIGANETSGSWHIEKFEQSKNALTTTFKMKGDEFSMSTPTGENYTAKLDGKDYPFKGVYSYNSVSLKRVNDHTIEQTDKRDGKVVDVLRMTVSPDGKQLTVAVTNTLMGRTSIYVAEKQ